MINSLLQSVLSTIPNPVFTMAELKVLHSGSDDGLHSMIKRAMAQGDIISIRRGLYMLGPLFRPVRPDPLFIAGADFDAIDQNYHHTRVGRFLAGIRKELGLLEGMRSRQFEDYRVSRE